MYIITVRGVFMILSRGKIIILKIDLGPGSTYTRSSTYIRNRILKGYIEGGYFHSSIEKSMYLNLLKFSIILLLISVE